ncbi:hypothetical protein OQA88_6198 [Cercophora sp. LCS_1]
MAKGTVAKGRTGPSKRSRAARRATDVDIDTDKSLKNVKVPEDSSEKRPSVLAVHRAAGVSKKTKHKVLSSKMRKRQEKSMDRAEAIMDRTANKVQRSKQSFKVIQSRKRTWEEVNKDATGTEVPAKKGKSAQRQAEDDAVAEFYGDDDDEEMDEAVEMPQGSVRPVMPSIHAPVSGDDDEEIL